MTNVLILGANGQLARNTTGVFLRDTDAQLTLYLRRASRLRNLDPKRVTIFEGDVVDRARLEAAMKGQDVVYANLAGDMKRLWPLKLADGVATRLVGVHRLNARGRRTVVMASARHRSGTCRGSAAAGSRRR